MSACLEIILDKCKIEDTSIHDYIESIFEHAHEEFQTADDVYEMLGPILESSVSSDLSYDIEDICRIVFNTFNQNSNKKSAIRKLDEPVHLATKAALQSQEDDFTNDNIWIAKKDQASLVDQKKLEKAEAKIKQKQDKKSSVKITTDKPLIMAEASASQRLSRKNEKSETHGTYKVKDIHIENFDIAFGSKVLFEGADLHVAYSRRYGLIGRNGMGKTTLLKMLSTRNLSLPSHISILHVEQEVAGDDTIALQSVLESDIVRESLIQEERNIQLKMAGNKAADPELSTRLSEIYSKLNDIEADKAPARAAIVLNGLGFTSEMQKMMTKEFSGGWRMRLALARALFAKPDLLLLDEPTNMLDVRAILWLEDYLQTWPSTIIVVSHDRNFLDSICTDILHLRQRQLDSYKGTFEQFMVTKDEKAKNRQKEYETQKAYRDHLQVFIDRFRYNANRAAQVQSKLKILEKLPEIIPFEKEKEVIMKFPTMDSKLSGTVLKLDEVTFRYSENGRAIFKNVDISAALDSRICIVGENGSGKTTMLKILTGSLEPVAGVRYLHRNVRIGYFSQHHVDQLDMNLTCIGLMEARFPGRNNEEYRHQLGSYGVIGDLALRPVGSLSGGQKSRLAFAIMSMTRPNFLILDEPTNHLDMETIEALGIAINKFGGGVILVSHDERLIQVVCKELWLCGNQQVKAVEGGFETYKKLLKEEFNRIGIK